MRKEGVIFFLLFVAVLNYGSQGSAFAADPGAGRLALTDAMLKMMDAMGMIGQSAGAGGGRHYDRTWESPAPARKDWPWHQGSPPQTGAWRDVPSRGELDGSLERHMALQGDWTSQSGEWLQIRGSRFRLRGGAQREVDGTLSVRDQLLALHSPRYNQTWIYQFAEQDGRLVLRDARGQMYLYRRVQPRMRGPASKRRPSATR